MVLFAVIKQAFLILPDSVLERNCNIIVEKLRSELKERVQREMAQDQGKYKKLLKDLLIQVSLCGSLTDTLFTGSYQIHGRSSFHQM